MKTTVIAAALVGLALVSGCSSSGTSTAASKSASPSSSPSASMSPTDSASPSPSPTPSPSATLPPGTAKLGRTQPYSSHRVVANITVLSFTDRADTNGGKANQAGNHDVAVLVRFCLTAVPQPVALSWMPWTLRYPDGAAYEALQSYSTDTLLTPLYPNDDSKTAPVGTCTRGWIPFEVTNGSGRPMEVEYSASDTTRVWRF